MKSTFFCNYVENTVNIFSLNSVESRKTGLSYIQLSSSTKTPFFDSEDASEDPASKSAKKYDKAGFTEDKIAIEVDAEDVLKYLGT